MALLLSAGIAFVLAHFRSKVRRESQIEELVIRPKEVLERDPRALDLYRSHIATGDIPTAQLLPDGPFTPPSPNASQAFLADHGALLVVSRGQDLWQCVPHRPIVMSEYGSSWSYARPLPLSHREHCWTPPTAISSTAAPHGFSTMRLKPTDLMLFLEYGSRHDIMLDFSGPCEYTLRPVVEITRHG